MNIHYNKKKAGHGIKTAFICCLLMLVSGMGLSDLHAQVQTVWTVDAPESNWFLDANTERGITYNPATGNLYIASRQGGVTPVILDAATGDSLGVLTTMRPKADTVDPIWTIEAPAGGWFTEANTERGITYNPATGNLIIASRQGGVTPVLVNAATGDSVGVMSGGDIGGGTFPYNQISATADGQIFTANLAINQVTRIYRWENEEADPVEIYADSLGQRLGDSFSLVGEGEDVTLLLSGGGAEKVSVFNWNGTDLTLTDEYTVPGGVARGGFSNGTVADSVIISGTGTAPRYFNFADGTLGSEIASPDVSAENLNSSMLNDLIEYNGRTLAAFGPAFTNGLFYLLDLSDDGALIDEIGPIGANENLNNAGGVLFDTDNSRLYLMDTNNAIHAYNIADFFPQPVIAGGTFPYNQIASTADGQIFTANLAIGQTTRIYRWENEGAVPELIYSDSLGQRLGDSFGVIGEGDDVTVLLSGGSQTDKVSVFNWNGSELSLTDEFPIAANEARGGFSRGMVADSVIISGTGTAPRFMNITDGALGSVITSPDIESADLNSSMLNDLITVEGRTFAAFGPAFSNGMFYLIDLADGSKLEEFGPLGDNSNINNTGGVIFDADNMRLYLMDTNNAIVALDISSILAGDTDDPIANVQVIHNSADPAAASVDIFINGELALEGVDFRTATSFIELPANTEIDIVISPAGEGIEAGFEFEGNIFDADENYYVIATGVLDPDGFAINPDGVDIGFSLDVISGAMLEGDAESFTFLISHGSTDAPTVDVSARSVGMLAEGLEYLDVTEQYLEVPADTYTIDVLPAGDDTPVASFEADVSALSGSTGIVLASGFLTPVDNQDGEPFGLIVVLVDGTVVVLPSVATSIDDAISGLPKQFELNQNYPNPFNPSTKIEYSLPQAANVQISVYNVMGQQVATLINNEQQSAGYHTVSFDASNLASGMYLYRIQAGNFVQTRKMTLIK